MKKFALDSITNSLKNKVTHENPFLRWSDSYKFSHILFELDGVKEMYSNLTPRFDKYMVEMLGSKWDRKIVVFGIQQTILKMHTMMEYGFFRRDKTEVIGEMEDELGRYIAQEKIDQFEKLHDLGYLPIQLKALDEGTLIKIGTPVFTIRNTLPGFEWLPNFLETGLSMEMWKPITVATIARHYRMISNDYAEWTSGDINNAMFQNHDFSSRGQPGLESCASMGVAFLLSSVGTDNAAALWYARDYYFSQNTPNDLLCASVPAGEHSVTTLGILTIQERHKAMGDVIDLKQAEKLYAEWLLTERFPKGIVSYVADSYDYWTFITEILPLLKTTIMARDGKFVVRGDSGDPVHVIAGYRIRAIEVDNEDDREINLQIAELFDNGIEVVKIKGKYWKILSEGGKASGLIEISQAEALGTITMLYEIFGGTENKHGYVELDSHVGMIYGDSITPARSEEILNRLEEKMFASHNIVFGVGSYSLSMLSRDFLGMAVKATNVVVDVNGVDVDKPIYKDPKTDSSKKSLRGLLHVGYDDNGEIVTTDNVSREMEKTGLLTDVYVDGDLFKKTTIFEIRDRMWK